MRWQNSYHKKSHALEFLAPNRYEIGLLNEVLEIHFSQGATKLWSLKIRGPKKSKKRCCRIRAFVSLYVVVHGRILAKIRKFKNDQLWAPAALQPPDQNECLVPLLKDLN